jgi:opacity protein-like surface antigen
MLLPANKGFDIYLVHTIFTAKINLFMKKIITFIFVLAAIAPSFAQEQKAESKFHFGLKATPSLAWLRSDSKEFESDGSKFGFNYGLIADFNFGSNNNYAFSTGIDITYRGGKFKQEVLTPGLTMVSNVTYSLQYVEIPLTLKLKTNEIGYMTYFLQFGFAPGVNIRSRSDSSVTQETAGVSKKYSNEDNDIQEEINNLNVSMVIAAGAEYNLSGNTNLMLGVVFNNGFLDVFDDSDLKANSNYLGLMVGILF